MTNKEAADILENRMNRMKLYADREKVGSGQIIETIEAIQTAIECLRKEGE